MQNKFIATSCPGGACPVQLLYAVQRSGEPAQLTWVAPRSDAPAASIICVNGRDLHGQVWPLKRYDVVIFDA